MKTVDSIDEQAVVNLAKRLVKNKSISGEEKKILTLLAIELKKAGFTKVQYDKKNFNIIGKVAGTGKGESLALVGHLDTVPEGTMADPYQAKIMKGKKLGSSGEVLYGRGACSMKGGLAAMIAAGAAMKRARLRLKGDFMVIALSRSETNESTGLRFLLQKFDLEPDYIISTKPTNMKINTGYPGYAFFELLMKGQMAPIGLADKGDNAIIKIGNASQALLANSKLTTHDLYGKASFVLSSIESQPRNQWHSVPPFCKAHFVRKFFPEEKPADILESLKTILKKNGFDEKNWRLNIKNQINPYDLGPETKPIPTLKEIAKKVIGKTPKLGYWTSGIHLSDVIDAKLPVIGFGPGDDSLAHTPKEHVPLSQVIDATKVYAALGEKICLTTK
jgi:succinyl-diaminopimelate desuccinylase